MARPGHRREPSSGPRLLRVNRGEVLGMVTRQTAERGYLLYQDHRIDRLVWTGEDIETELRNPSCTVQVSEAARAPFLIHRCSFCRHASQPCPHVTASLLQWLDVRTAMQRMGPGTVWQSHSRHPFLTPSRTAADRVDLSHLLGSDLRSALELQLSLQRSGTATATLAGEEVEIRITLPSGDTRVVSFNAAVLPAALPLLRSLPRIELVGDLASLEVSEARLQPVLVATWQEDGILLEPGYRLGQKTVFAAHDIADRINGRWVHLGSHLCLALDPATPLVPFFRSGRQVLKGQEALRFLTLDHSQLRRHSWYLPTGHLASFREAAVPQVTGLEAEADGQDRVVLRPSFSVAGRDLEWPAATELLSRAFGCVGGQIVRAPDLDIFERSGFALPRRRLEQGLVGDRLSFIRLVAETGLPIIGGDGDLRELAAILQGRSAAPIPRPPGLRSHLRPYQQEGVGWLWSRYAARVGALLADDMGLGKTHQVMGLMCSLQERRPDARFLVVCPRGVLEHWLNLLTTFAPRLRLQVFHGPGRSLEASRRQSAVVITTYDILLRSVADLSGQQWDVAIFDEAQRLKNPRTKAARAARKVEAAFRVALTGTPLENRLAELWSVMDLVLPGYLGSEREFRLDHRSPSQNQLQRLRRRVSILTLRRLKQQVLSDLPDKVEDLRYCQLTPEQGELYRSIHAVEASAIAERLHDPDADIPYMHIFALLTRLKQLCDHPALVTGGSPSAGLSGKLEIFDQILDEALGGNHQVVVFSQYVKMIKLMKSYLHRRHIPTLALTGETKDRGRIIRRFNSGQHERVLLASLLAGGVGIDLTGASVVIHYDRWWNPAKENQATDRVHRIGQRQFVHVFKLITRDTVEERIDTLIRSKLDLAEQVVAPTEEVVRSLSRCELVKLLGVERARDG